MTLVQLRDSSRIKETPLLRLATLDRETNPIHQYIRAPLTIKETRSLGNSIRDSDSLFHHIFEISMMGLNVHCIGSRSLATALINSHSRLLKHLEERHQSIGISKGPLDK